MDLEIMVRVKGQHFTGGACVSVPDVLVEAFEPLGTTDDPLMAVVCGEVWKGDQKLERALKIRESAAKELADQIAFQLINEMKKHDTHNGYT